MQQRYLLALVSLAFASCDSDNKPLTLSHVEAPAVRAAYFIPREGAINSKPDDGSSILAELHQHDTLHVALNADSIITKKGWSQVVLDKEPGYGFIQTQWITPAKFAHPARVRGKKVVLRENPSVYNLVIKTLNTPDSVDVLSNFDDKWAHVCLKDGTVGFIEHSSLTLK